MDTHIAALQRAFLDGLADSTQLTSLSRAQNTRNAQHVAPDQEPPAPRRVVRRERHVTFVERRPVVRAGRVLRLHGGRRAGTEPGRNDDHRGTAGAA